jgi:tetratricopeptide (TPR) repeat protein
MQMQHKKYFIRKMMLSFFIFHFSFFIADAQWYDPDKVNKKAGELYGQAYEEATDGKYTAAINHLNEALAIEPKFVDVFLSRAGIYAELKNYSASVTDCRWILFIQKRIYFLILFLWPVQENFNRH